MILIASFVTLSGSRSGADRYPDRDLLVLADLHILLEVSPDIFWAVSLFSEAEANDVLHGLAARNLEVVVQLYSLQLVVHELRSDRMLELLCVGEAENGRTCVGEGRWRH